MARKLIRTLPIAALSGFLSSGVASGAAWDDCLNLEDTAALPACTSLIDASDTDAKIRFMAVGRRAVIKERQGKLDEAMVDWQLCDAINPNDPFCISGMSDTLLWQGRYEEALVQAERALAIDPNDYHANVNKGLALHEFERFDEAIAAFDRAIIQNPQDASAIAYRGVTYAAQWRHKEAIDDFTKALVILPDMTVVRGRRAVSAYYLGNVEDARADIARCLVESAENPTCLYGRAMIALFEGNAKASDTLVDLNKFISQSPNDASALELRALAYAHQGKFAEAIADLDAAGLDDMVVAIARAIILENQPDKAGALDLYRKVLDGTATSYVDRRLQMYAQERLWKLAPN